MYAPGIFWDPDQIRICVPDCMKETCPKHICFHNTLPALTSLETSDDGAFEDTETAGLREPSVQVVEGPEGEGRPIALNFPGVA